MDRRSSVMAHWSSARKCSVRVALTLRARVAAVYGFWTKPLTPALERADGLDFVEAAKQIVVEVTFLLEAPAREALAALTSEQLNATTVLITKDYSGYFEIQFPEQPIVFPDRFHPNSADELCDRLLPTVHAQAGETRSFTPPTRDRSQSSSVD